MRRRTVLTLIVGTVVLVSVAVGRLSGAQQGDTPAGADLEQAVRAGFAAWNAHDAAKISERDSTAVGFGYLTRAVRSPSDSQATLAVTKSFFASMVSFQIAIDEIHTATDGDVGMAWGYYTEEFQVRGRPPEVVHARFSATFRRDGQRWRQLLFHRDAQPFDSQGRYLYGQYAR